MKILTSREKILTSFETTREEKLKKKLKNLKKILTSILVLLTEGHTQTEIAKILNFSKPRINYYFSRYLIPEGYVNKVGYGVWEVTTKGYDFLVKTRSSNFDMGVVGKFELLSKDKPRIEIWGAGYSFLTTKTFNPERLGLKKITLRNRGYFYHGHIKKCYVRYHPAKHELIIKAPLTVSDIPDFNHILV